MTIIITALQTLRSEGKPSLVHSLAVTVDLDETCSTIKKYFPNKEVRLSMKDEEIEELLSLQPAQWERLKAIIKNVEITGYFVGPVVKKLLSMEQINLSQEVFASIDEFMSFIPDCNFKHGIIELQQTSIPGAPIKTSWLARKTNISEKNLSHEITTMLTHFANKKYCSKCSDLLGSISFECLDCPNYRLCHECEKTNFKHSGHDDAHLLAQLTKETTLNCVNKAILTVYRVSILARRC